jgi:murein L,D-transpeptidase YafK
MRHPRVRAAFALKEKALRDRFKRKHLSYPPRRILIRILKREQLVELWTERSDNSAYELVRQYSFCANSGGLGPKLREGDGQIPEGFYRVDRFNPQSNFYLSLGISYPNQADRIRSTAKRLGGDIFIHGGCATIGCIPITDDGIAELYILTVEARSMGQDDIPIHIFPARLDSVNFDRLRREYSGRGDLIRFWANLKEAYDYFSSTSRPPRVTLDAGGRYVVMDQH